VLPAFLAAITLLLASPATAVHASDAEVPVWIWSNPDGKGRVDELLRLLDRFGLPNHSLSQLEMVTFQSDARTARALGQATGGRIDANQVLPLHLDKSVPSIGADRVKQAVGPQRNGPSVLVVDTGVDSVHPDFQAGNLAANVQPVRFGGLIVASTQSVPVVDLAGHGTHVAGIVAGSGASLGPGDPLRGTYVGAFSNGRVVSYQASSVTTKDQEAGVEVIAALEGFDWALQNQAAYNIRVVSNSWGDRGDFDPQSPIHQATLRLYLRGMVVVFSAGNAGEEGAGTLNRYCVAPWVLCVAAGDLSNARTGFSSYGRMRSNEPYDHPDLTAPGLFIHAPNPVNDAGGRTAGALLGGVLRGDALYTDRSGTSMAAPHVAAAAALLYSARPQLSPDQVMDILVASTKPMADGVERVGSGFVDVRSAYNLAVSATGNRAAFLTGQEVKYAGPLTRDPNYANDPVSVGYDGPTGSSALALARPGDALWILGPFAMVLVGLALLSALLGTRWRPSKR
jgi:serine protease AprX